MRISSAELLELDLPLVEPFETSFGVERRRRVLLIRLRDRAGLEGLGECVAAREPLYSGETVETVEWAWRRFLVPLVLSSSSPEEFVRRADRWRGHRMAKAAIEMAFHDLGARRARRPLAAVLGGTRATVEVGVSVGIQPTVEGLVRRVGQYLADGYRRVKLKVRPGWDARPVRAVRRAYPELRLWVDANQAYSPRSAAAIRSWATRFEVEQVEQPFPDRAIRAHALLQRGAPFRVCLDESVVDESSLRDALDARALKSLNVKPGRVGGLNRSLELATIARRQRIPSWVGGMLETGIGRAFGVHLASCAPFILPADLSASGRYFSPDIVTEPFRLLRESRLRVPPEPGIGVTMDLRTLRRYLVRSQVIRSGKADMRQTAS